MTALEEENVFAQEEQHPHHDHSENDDRDSVKEKEDAQVKAPLPEGAILMPVFQQYRWPTWRKMCWSNWHIVPWSGVIVAQCKSFKDGWFHVGSKNSFSNFVWHLRRNHEDEYQKSSGTEMPTQSSL
jgi:hypothetical protein